MEYRNIKTGIVIHTECSVSGEDWEAVETASAENERTATEEKPPTGASSKRKTVKKA